VLALISFITYAFLLLAVHDILNNVLRVHNSKASIYLLFAFLSIHHSHPYSTAGKSVVCTSLTGELVETPEAFVTYVIFAIAALHKLIVVLLSFLVQLPLVMTASKNLLLVTVLISSPFTLVPQCSFLRSS
jgi:hypothetical protein